ncbi:ABC transporter ATP-binding protein [Micromonospora okii]|uniref:ABC transporter ATP-binding protein n=1 Tax=Micromonospora okii TaxID=1182970 RepID=UPI001E60B720|nr:ABC transporter ATP-binding protein [Micromonospora okii]
MRRLRLVRLFGGAGGYLAAGSIAAHLVAALLPVAAAAVTGWFVHLLGAPDTGRDVFLAVALLVGMALLAPSVAMGRDILEELLVRRVDGRVRSEVRLVAHGPSGTAHLETAAFQSDALRASDAGVGIGRIRSPGTAAAGQIVVLFRYVSALAGAALLATFSVPLAVGLFVAAVVVRLRLHRQWLHLAAVKDADADGQRRLTYLAELAVTGAVKEMRVFGLADWLLRRRHGLMFRVHGPTWRQMWRVLRSQKFALVVGTASVAASLAVPAVATLTGRIGTGTLVTALVAGGTVLSLASMGDEAFDIEYGFGAVRALDRLHERYADSASTPRRPVDPPQPRPDPPEVRFEQVCFAYPDGPPVLSGLSLVLGPGETVALAGANGAGKSTLIRLLGGLNEPTDGRITVDGTPLIEVDTAGWRRTVAVVPQEFVRYPASLADNVALAAPEHLADRNGTLRALRQAGAASLVERLPQGLDTMLGWESGGGVDLSGGQWQRIAVARALFAAAHGRRLLVLDEPTAHLDVVAEAEFYERVVAAVRGRATVVLISHRLSTLRPADRILLLRDGRVVEEGDHGTLMAAGGEYQRLFMLQAARFGEPDGRPTCVPHA